MASPQSVGTANLAIATERPYTIILSDAGVQNLLGYAPEDIRGRGLQLLHGPKTDPLLLHLAIEQAAQLRPSTVSVVLYDRLGLARSVACSLLPLCDPDGSPEACLLTLAASEVLTIADALCEMPCAKVIHNNNRFSSYRHSRLY